MTYEVFPLSFNEYLSFVIAEKEEVRKILQVSYSIEEPERRKREINGLLEACRRLNQREGTIITMFNEETIKLDDITIQVAPA